MKMLVEVPAEYCRTLAVQQAEAPQRKFVVVARVARVVGEWSNIGEEQMVGGKAARWEQEVVNSLSWCSALSSDQNAVEGVV